MKDRLIIAITWVCVIGLCLAFWGVAITAAFGRNVNYRPVIASLQPCNLHLALVSMHPERVARKQEQHCKEPLGKFVVD